MILFDRSTIVRVFIFGLLVALVVSCRNSSVQPVLSAGHGFGTQAHNDALGNTAYVSLLHTNKNGQWITVWNAISFRSDGGPRIWNDAVLFGAATDKIQADKGLLRWLYFTESAGVVDVTDLLIQRAGIHEKISVSYANLGQADANVQITFESNDTSGSFIVKASFDELAQMARTISSKKNKRTFDGNEFFE